MTYLPLKPRLRGPEGQGADGVFTSCRHRFCSHLAMQGAPMRGVQELAGHQSLAMTQRDDFRNWLVTAA